MNTLIRTTNWHYLAIIVLLFAVVQVLWMFPAALYPLTILTTVFHELSHGFAALLTGGRIVELTINPNGSGLARTVGGSQMLIAPAGYIGATLAAALLLLTVRWRRAGRVLLYALAALLVVAVLFWIRGPFGMFFTLLLAAGFAGVAWKAPAIVVQWLNPFLAAGLLREALDDSWGLVRFFGQHNDAAILAQQTGMPSIVYSITWTILALAIALFAIYIGSRGHRPPLPTAHCPLPTVSEPAPVAASGSRGDLLRELQEQGLLDSDR